MKYLGITLSILSAIGISFLLFNNVLQAVEFFVKYGNSSMIVLLVCFISSTTYAIVENLDGEGW